MYKIVHIFLVAFIAVFAGCAGTTDNLYKFDYVSMNLVSDMTSEVSKTSGLIDVEGRLFTHNDSGDPYLYEINATTGLIERTITVTGATNVAWEDIADGDDYVYIGDIGNPNGTRDDLKIYKISKTDLLDNNIVNAQEISFAYADQISFNTGTNNSPYDAQALIVYNGALYIFTKNWDEYTTQVYEIPVTPGYYSVSEVTNYSFEVMITAASVDKINNSVALLGYSDPYDATLPQLSELIILSDFTNSNFFSGAITTYEITEDQTSSRLEGLAYSTPSELYLTTEAIDSYPARLYELVLP